MPRPREQMAATRLPISPTPTAPLGSWTLLEADTIDMKCLLIVGASSTRVEPDGTVVGEAIYESALTGAEDLNEADLRFLYKLIALLVEMARKPLKATLLSHLGVLLRNKISSSCNSLSLWDLSPA